MSNDLYIKLNIDHAATSKEVIATLRTADNILIRLDSSLPEKLPNHFLENTMDNIGLLSSYSRSILDDVNNNVRELGDPFSEFLRDIKEILSHYEIDLPKTKDNIYSMNSPKSHDFILHLLETLYPENPMELKNLQDKICRSDL